MSLDSTPFYLLVLVVVCRVVTEQYSNGLFGSFDTFQTNDFLSVGQTDRFLCLFNCLANTYDPIYRRYGDGRSVSRVRLGVDALTE